MTTAPPSSPTARGDDVPTVAAQAVDAETAVVAAALWSRQAYSAAAALVNAAAFWRPAHEAIWRALEHLATSSDEAWDPLLVSDRMRITQEHVDYIRDVARLSDYPWVASTVIVHARRVARAAAQRHAHQVAVRLAKASTLADADEFRDQLTEAVDRLQRLARAWDAASPPGSRQGRR